MMTHADKASLEAFAERALRTLGKEDLLFTHHGQVMARPAAYTRLAELIADMYQEGKM